MPAFFIVSPELAGYPAGGGALPVLFDTWLGDDLVSAFPVLLATTPLQRGLRLLKGSTGFELERARTKAAPFFRRHNPGRRLPVFWAIRVTGWPGVDDMGLTPDRTLVVSGRVLEVFVRFRVNRAVFAQYVPLQIKSGSQAAISRGRRT